MNTMEPLPESGTPPTTPAMSLPARLLNVFADPGDVFEQVKTGPKSTGNWLVPAFLLSLVMVVSFLVIFSQPAIMQQIRDQQAKAFDAKVKDGTMTQAQADNALAGFDKMAPSIMKIALSIFGVVVSFLRLFWWAFILWLLNKMFLKAELDYMKLVEVVGLASMIMILATVVGTLVTIFRGQITYASLALLINNFDPKNRQHALIGMWNPFTMWSMGLMAAGVARLSGRSLGRVLAIVGGFWVLWNLLLIGIGHGEWAM